MVRNSLDVADINQNGKAEIFVTNYSNGSKRLRSMVYELKGSKFSRIVSVADVFDALTSRRPYKEAWSNEMAVKNLQQLAGEKLDKDCVNALLDNMDEVVKIQQQFCEDRFG